MAEISRLELARRRQRRHERYSTGPSRGAVPHELFYHRTIAEVAEDRRLLAEAGE